MKQDNNQTMKIEHQLWNKEHSAWRSDTKSWRGDIKAMIAELSDIKAMLKEHDAALQSHLATIGEHEKQERKHEEALKVKSIIGESKKSEGPFVEIHAKESQAHDLQRDAHERMKKHQYTIVGRWGLVRDALRAAM